MNEIIPWETQAHNDDGPCGTLRDVIIRWREHVSRDHEELTGVFVVDPVFLEGWAAPLTDLWPQHLNELSTRLDARRYRVRDASNSG